MLAGRRPAVCFFGQDLVDAELVAEEVLPVRTSEWMTTRDISQMPGGESKTSKAGVAELLRVFEKKSTGGIARIPLGSQVIRMQKMRSGTTPCVCFFRPDVLAAGLCQEHALPEKTAEWMSSKGVKAFPHGGTIATQNALLQLAQAYEACQGVQQPDGGRLLDYEGHSIHVQKMQAVGMQPICFLKDDLIAAGLIGAAVRRQDKATRVRRKDISPGSDDLKRMGRSRTTGTDE